jgi:hypothetical protein
MPVLPPSTPIRAVALKRPSLWREDIPCLEDDVILIRLRRDPKLGERVYRPTVPFNCGWFVISIPIDDRCL